jgi:hypothetical protein
MKAMRIVPAALAAAAAFAALSCGDQSPTQPRPSADLFGWVPRHVSLLSCRPQPYDSVTQTIGPEGGTITVGSISLIVPDSALDSAVTITAVAPSDTVNAVRFQPAGLHFQQKASLVMSYANCGVLGFLVPRHIAYTDDSLNILSYIPSVTNILSRTVTGDVRHFSEYALAW